MKKTQATPSKKNHILSHLIKATIVGALLYFLAKKGFISFHDTKKAFGRWDIILPVALVLLCNTFLGVIRWQWLLRAQKIELPWMRTTQLAFVGNFFNIALPGAVSGDIIKAYYIGKELHGRRGKAFGTILFDRIIGVSGLGLVSAGALLFGYDSFKGSTLLAALRVFISMAAVGTLVFYAYLFLVRENYDPLLLAFKKLEKKIQKMGSLTRIYEGVRHYHDHRGVVLKCLILSIYIHMSVAWSCLQLAHALGEQTLPLGASMVVVPLGLLVTAVPVAPAGIGTGHAAFLYLFQLMGSQRGADVFTLFALFNLIIGAIGGVVYLRFRTKEPMENLDPAQI